MKLQNSNKLQSPVLIPSLLSKGGVAKADNSPLFKGGVILTAPFSKGVPPTAAGVCIQSRQRLVLCVLFALFIFCIKSYGEDAGNWDLFSTYYQEQSNINQITLTDDIVVEDAIGYTPNNNVAIYGNAHFLDGDGKAGFFFDNKTITFNAITIMNFNDAFEIQNSQIKFLSSGGGMEIRITSNTRQWHGGAMAIDTRNDVSFEKALVFITSNTSQMNAGGIYVETDSKISFVNSSAVFAHNQAQTVGGGLFIRESQAHFLNSNIVFENNRSTYGGAISFLSANDMLFENTDIEFKNNIAQNGGAIFGGASAEPGAATNLRFINSRAAFFGNDADYGTAIYLNEEQKIEFINSTVIFGDNAGVNKTILFIHDDARVSFIGGAVVFSSNTHGRMNFINEKRNLFFAPSKVVFADNIREYDDGIFDYDDFKTDYNGFLMNGNSILFPIEVLRNRTSNGGFLAFEGDGAFALTFQAGGIFRGNEASEKGGVFYLAHSAVSLTSNGDMIFNGNLADGEPNDIFLEGSAALSLIVANGAKVLLGGGLKGDSDSRIIKIGGGDLVLGGNTNYEGDVILQEGAIVVVATQSIKLNSLNVGRGAVFRADGSDVHITTITNANFDGKFESALILINGSLDLNNKLYIEDEMTAADPSFLLLTTRLETRSIQAAIENYQGGIEIFLTASQDMHGLGLHEKEKIHRGGSDIYYSLNYNDDGSLNIVFTKAQSRLNADLLDLTKDETESARWIDSVRGAQTLDYWKSVLYRAADEGQANEIKKSLHALKGTFLVNVLKLGAPSIDFSDLYDEIDSALTERKSGKFVSLKWKSGYENFKSDDPYENEFKTNYQSFKVSLENVKRFGNVYGFFLNYESKSISQNPNNADIDDFSLGIYGAKSAGRLKAKGIAALSVKTFDIKRDVQIIDLSFQPQSGFALYGAKAGFELSYQVKKKRLTIEPFAAFAIESLKGGEISEDSAVGLYADPGFLTYSEIDWGIKMESGWKRLGWNVKGYFGYDILSPNVLNVRFANDNSGSSLDIEAMENERLFIGAGLFARYSLTSATSIFAGVDSKRSIKNFMRASSAYLGLTIKI